MTNWQVVDKDGDVVITADTIAAVARQQRTTPRRVAEHAARNHVNVEAGDEPVYAVACE